MCSVYAQSTHTSHVHSVYTQYAIGSTHGQCVHSVCIHVIMCSVHRLYMYQHIHMIRQGICIYIYAVYMVMYITLQCEFIVCTVYPYTVYASVFTLVYNP